MKPIRSCALLLILMLTGGLAPAGSSVAHAATAEPDATALLLRTSVIKVHGYRLQIQVDRITDDFGTDTFLQVAMSRREKTGDTSQFLGQAHMWGWALPKTAFHLHRDLSHGWIDTGERMRALGHLRMRFSATGGLHTAGAGCHASASRTGRLDGNTSTAFILRTDGGFFGTLKARSFGARASRFALCSSGGGGGQPPCPVPGLFGIVADQGTFARAGALPTHLPRATFGIPSTLRPTDTLRQVTAAVATHQYALFIRSQDFNVLEFVTGGNHEAHLMELFTQHPFVTGGINASSTDVQIAPPATVATWLSGSESITGPGDPRPANATCKDRTFRDHADDSIVTTAGLGGALTAHFDQVGDVAMPDGLEGFADQVRRVS
jgi:hypothetical protein